VQNCRSSVTIEQNGDTGGTVAQFDNDTNLAGQFWETGGAKVTHLEASADCNSVGFLNHLLAY
jgi:hypothetical protein